MCDPGPCIDGVTGRRRVIADIALSVTVSRDALALAALEIASGGTYYLSPQFLGGQVTWKRQQASSVFLDGDVTTQRSRGTVTEAVGVEVRAATHAELQAATAVLIAAFSQDSFTMTVVVAGATTTYACEAADYQSMGWTTPRLACLANQVLFQMPRQPVALAGV